MRVLQLSDTHVARAAGPSSFGVDPRESLALMVASLEHLTDIDLVVLSGDVADDGSAEGSRAVLAALRPLAQRLDAPLVCCVGNHDLREPFTEVFGSGHLAPDGRDIGRSIADSADSACAAVSEVAGHRVVTLDALVPGKAYGWISQPQLDWLAAELSTPFCEGTVVVFHQPPFALDVEVQRAFQLQNPKALAEVLAGTDVRVVLCGHFHQPIVSSLAGIPVVVAPAVLNRIDVTAAAGTERALRGAGVMVTTVDAAGVTSHPLYAQDPQGGQVAYELTEQQLAHVIAELGPEAGLHPPS